MTSVSWTQTTSGSWNTPGAWSGGANPLTGDDVTINTPNTPITVTYSAGFLSLDSLVTGSTDTLSVTGGTLATQGNGYLFNGALLLSGGMLRLVSGNNNGNFASLAMSGGSLFLANSATAQGGILNQTAGTITIAHGIFNDDENSGTLASLVTGGGELEFSNNSGTTVLASGCVLSTAAVDIASGTVYLKEQLAYAKSFSLFGTLDLNGFGAALGGHVALDGDVNGGTLTLSGNGHLNGLVLDNGAFLAVAGSINQTGNVQLGGNTGTGTLDIASNGTLNITGNYTMYQGASAGYLVNGGLLEKTGGGPLAGVTTISDVVTSTGIIDAAVGTIDFSGPGGGAQSTINGTLEGAGTIEFSQGSYLLGGGSGIASVNEHRLIFAGNTSSTNVTLASALSYGGNWEQTGGLLLFENNLTLNGISAMVGGELKGTATITDNGQLTLGAGMDLEGNLHFNLNGSVDQTGAINLGALSDSIDQATLSAGNTWALEGTASIAGNYGTITNLGTFVKLNGAQNAVVASQIVSTGALLVDTGTLSLTGQGTLGGTVGGAGVLDLSGQFTLAAGVTLSVGELILDQPAQTNDVQASLSNNLAYTHLFAQEGGTLALNGHTMTLSGVTSLDAGAILGNGLVLVTGAASIGNFSLSQGGTLQLNGVTEQSGNLTLTGGSTAPALTIGLGGSYGIDGGQSIGGPNGSVVGTVTVAGTLTASGFGSSSILATVQDSGTIQISHGQMQFLGPLTGSGAIILTAGGMLDLENTNFTSTGVTFGAGGGLLYLQDPSGYGGTIGGFASGDAVELNGFGFSSNGTLASFAVSGDTVTISEANNGPSMMLTFNAPQSASSLVLGEGAHGGLALIHV